MERTPLPAGAIPKDNELIRQENEKLKLELEQLKIQADETFLRQEHNFNQELSKKEVEMTRLRQTAATAAASSAAAAARPTTVTLEQHDIVEAINKNHTLGEWKSNSYAEYLLWRRDALEMAAHYHWSAATLRHKLLSAMKHEGNRYKCLDIQIPGPNVTHEEILKHFDAKLKRPPKANQREARNCKQFQHEAISVYATRLRAALQAANEGKEPSESKLIEKCIQGVYSDNIRNILSFADTTMGGFASFERFIEIAEANEEEKTNALFATAPIKQPLQTQQFKTPAWSTTATPGQDEPMDISAMTKSFKCYYCNTYGHIIANCIFMKRDIENNKLKQGFYPPGEAPPNPVFQRGTNQKQIQPYNPRPTTTYPRNNQSSQRQQSNRQVGPPGRRFSNRQRAAISEMHERIIQSQNQLDLLTNEEPEEDVISEEDDDPQIIQDENQPDQDFPNC